MRRSDKEPAIAKIDLQHFVSARNVTGQKIPFPDEFCDEPVARVPIDFRWCADLKQFAGVQNGDAVRDRERLLLIVRNIDGGQLKLPADAPDFLPHFQTQFRIQIGQRLIQEQARRPHDERSCESDSLLLAAGHFVDFTPSQVLEPNNAESFS